MNTKTLKETLLDGQNTKGPPKRRRNEGMEKAQPLQMGSTTVDKKRTIGEEGSRGTATQLINDLFISVSGNPKRQVEVVTNGYAAKQPGSKESELPSTQVSCSKRAATIRPNKVGLWLPPCWVPRF